ncbi:MAG: DDE domain-containing protein, partial [Proteobacteria bacterium]
YRVLRAHKLLTHHGKARPPVSRPRAEPVASAPCQVWSWDITYLRTEVRGQYFYLYLMMEVWSRKIVGFAVHDAECTGLAAVLLRVAVENEGCNAAKLVLHADNGGPMKGATLKATMENLGVIASYSRPRVSDDNPFSEALFRTVKYRPEYPNKPFASLEEARAWVAAFVAWYNDKNLHSGIGYVTPSARHEGRDVAILAGRRAVYEGAHDRHPERWSGNIRPWLAPAPRASVRPSCLRSVSQPPPSPSVTSTAAPASSAPRSSSARPSCATSTSASSAARCAAPCSPGPRSAASTAATSRAP